MEQAMSLRGHGVAHVMIMGNFNCPAIDYKGGLVHPGGEPFDTEPYYKTSEVFLVQNVFDHTRIKGCTGYYIMHSTRAT